MGFKFSKSSLAKLDLCHPDLRRVAERAIELTPYDFGITESLRTIETQKKYVAEGKSKTMNSRHLDNGDGVSEAIDIKIYVNGKITWDIGYFRKVAQVFFQAAIEIGVQIEWGGLWRTFVDGPHFQLKRGA